MAETLLNQEPKIETAKAAIIADTKRLNHQSRRAVGMALSLIMIGLTLYVLNLQNQNTATFSQSANLALNAGDQASVNYRVYVGKYRETKRELDETTRKLELVNSQLDQVTAELNTTKGMLTQTQSMLVLAQQENNNLKSELQGLGSLHGPENVQNLDDLQAKIKSLKQKNSEVTTQISDLKSQMRAFQAQFSTMAEGRALMTLFQDKIALVRARMNYLGEQAFMARVAAQKEKDHLAELNGNNGFIVRQGRLLNPNGKTKSFAIDVKIVQ